MAALNATKATGEGSDAPREYWKTQFHAEFAPPEEVKAAVENGHLIDVSYRNDVCPSFSTPKFEHGEKDLRLWVHPASPKDREYEVPRYAVTYYDWTNYDIDQSELYVGDDIVAAMNCLFAESKKRDADKA